MKKNKMSKIQPTDYDQIGFIGFSPIFDNLSDYFSEESEIINLNCLDKLQSDLDMEIVEWSVYENTQSKLLSGESKRSILSKYKKIIDNF